MENSNKYKIVYIIIAVLVILGFIYFNYNSFLNGPEVVIPGNYPVGTRISLYDNLPPEFPEELILENNELNYSGTISLPGGITKTTVSYFSDKTLSELVVMYEGALKDNGWSILKKSSSISTGAFQAEMENQKLILTIAPSKGKGMIITFQYEK